MKISQLPAERLLALLEILLNKPCISRKDLARRYGRTERTVDTWKADGTLPPPKWFHGPLWTPAQIAEAEANAGRLLSRAKSQAEAETPRLREHPLQQCFQLK